jgi:hypothetical protein
MFGDRHDASWREKSTKLTTSNNTPRPRTIMRVLTLFISLQEPKMLSLNVATRMLSDEQVSSTLDVQAE